MKILSRLIFTVFVISLFSCIGKDGDLEDLSKAKVEYLPASISQKEAFDTWLNKGSSARLATIEYSSSDLIKIVNKEKGLIRMAVVNKNDKNSALSFIFNEDNEIEFEVLSQSQALKNGSIKSKLTTLEGQLILEVIHFPDGAIEIMRGEFYDNLRLYGWWSDFDDCVGTVAAPFDSNVANIAMDVVFTSATLGLWMPTVLGACAVVASVS